MNIPSRNVMSLGANASGGMTSLSNGYRPVDLNPFITFVGVNALYQADVKILPNLSLLTCLSGC